MSDQKITNGWHLDKRVNLSVIGALIIYALVGIWQVSAMNSAIQHNVEEIENVEERVHNRIDRESLHVNDTLTRIESRLTRIEKKLDAQ